MKIRMSVTLGNTNARKTERVIFERKPLTNQA